MRNIMQSLKSKSREENSGLVLQNEVNFARIDQKRKSAQRKVTSARFCAVQLCVLEPKVLRKESA